MISSAQLCVAPSLQFIGNSLMMLDLSNSKVEFNTGYFKHGYIMQTLEVNYNNLREMPISLRMISDWLETLSLQGNNITTLKPLHEIRFTQLKWLFLSGNKIYALDPDALWLPRLRNMDLADNHIRQITDISTVPWGNMNGGSEPQLSLDGNPWHCNVSMNWLLQGLHRNEYGIVFKPNYFVISVGKWLCATPQEYQGRSVVDVLSIKPTTKNRGRKVNRGILCLTEASAAMKSKRYNVNSSSLWYRRAVEIYKVKYIYLNSHLMHKRYRLPFTYPICRVCTLQLMQSGLVMGVTKYAYIATSWYFIFQRQPPCMIGAYCCFWMLLPGPGVWHLNPLCHQFATHAKRFSHGVGRIKHILLHHDIFFFQRQPPCVIGAYCCCWLLFPCPKLFVSPSHRQQCIRHESYSREDFN